MNSTTSKSVDQFAFSVSLVAYDHALTDLSPAQRLGFREIKRNTKLSDLKDEEYTVPPTKPTDQELSIDQCDNVGVWVGMRPSSATALAIRGADEKATKGKSVNELALRGGFKILETDPKALRVVVPMEKETASYYALADQDDSGLCNGLATVVTEVFFFPEFRNDDLTDTAKRKSMWSELVRKYSHPVEKISFSKKYDKTKFQVPPRRALANELSSLIGTYMEGGDESVLVTAIDLIDRADNDDALTPPAKNTSLAKLAHSTTNMTDDECKAALSELLILAPALKKLNISSKELQCISAAIVDSGIVLPYAHTRAFLVQFISELRNGTIRDLDDEAALMQAAIRCSDHVTLQLGGKPRFVEREGDLDGLRLILDGQKKNMQNLKHYIQLAVKALKDSQGDSAIGSAVTLPQVWSKYGVSPDLDSAKLFGSGVHRHNVEALATILKPLNAMVDENCMNLDKLIESIPQPEPEDIEEM